MSPSIPTEAFHKHSNTVDSGQVWLDCIDMKRNEANKNIYKNKALKGHVLKVKDMVIVKSKRDLI